MRLQGITLQTTTLKVCFLVSEEFMVQLNALKRDLISLRFQYIYDKQEHESLFVQSQRWAQRCP